MLGMELSDPDGVEHGGTMRGLGLLPVKTIFTKEKVRTRVSGHFQNVSGVLQGLTGVAMTGYEIHMGQTISNGEDTAPLTMIQQIQEQPCRQQDGSQSGNIYGTYIPVSYTHLDVYKRQYWRFCADWLFGLFFS